MLHQFRKVFILMVMVILLGACNVIGGEEQTSDNLINKVNAVEDSWVNHVGEMERNNTMTRSQFIPYDPDKEYEVNYPTYISYYNGESFIRTERFQDTPAVIDAVEEADGVIVSFNKKNENGMKLVEADDGGTDG